AGETLLIVAARSNNVAAAKALALDAEVVDETDNEEWSALLNAAHKGHTEVVKILLENGASVDQPDYLGWTPLMWAVYKCHPDVVDLLLNYGAHVNLIDEEDGLTPLIVASGRGFTTVVEKLLAADAQVRLIMRLSFCFSHLECLLHSWRGWSGSSIFVSLSINWN
ncbi:unnamed protein product, partial [Heligmosomoides polygyrus]|uniref:ANK_REP_REGION domain-containing protein n=1 Tax=Heligmosomoides polygyrus TaxID=6339 RepID=A0A183GSQ9_HELPZ